MNLTGCIQHNLIAPFVVLIVGALTGWMWLPMFVAAFAIGLVFMVREAAQRRKDFPGIGWATAFELNWTGPREPHWRPTLDAKRSKWDWRVQGYAPTVSALGAAVVCNL